MKNLIEKIRFKFINWIEDKFPSLYCWADLVAWAVGSSSAYETFKKCTGKYCASYSLKHTHGLCYCGKFQNGKLRK